MAEETRHRRDQQSGNSRGSQESRGIDDQTGETWAFEHDNGNPNNAAVTNIDRNESDRKSDGGNRQSDRGSDRGSGSDR